MPLYLVPILAIVAMLLASAVEAGLARRRRPRPYDWAQDYDWNETPGPYTATRVRLALTRSGSNEALARRLGR